jgi:hypothetical protein
LSEGTPVASGRCECGAVAFWVDGPLRDVVACHCTQCRRTSGHYSADTSASVAHVRFVTDGTLVWYRSSDTAERGFCGRCGSNLFWRPLGEPQRISIAAGSLNGGTGLRIARHLFTADRGDYYALPSDEAQSAGW